MCLFRKFEFLLLIILQQVIQQEACSPPVKIKIQQAAKISKNATDKEAAQIWDYYVKEHTYAKMKNKHFPNQELPLKKKAEYGRWLMKYVAQKQIDKKKPEPFLSQFDKPKWWSGEGGEYGELPPPWGYLPGTDARPQYCYYRFERGVCTNLKRRYTFVRFGYNSLNNTCDSFRYSGCGGNENRFIRKADCEKACISPKTCCDSPAGYPEDYPEYYGRINA